VDGDGYKTKYRNRQTFGSCTNIHLMNGPNERSDGPAVAEFDEPLAVVVAAVVVAVVVVVVEGYKDRCRSVERLQCDSSMELPESSRQLQRVRRRHDRPDGGPLH
jgi:hypothetical protein